jgi:agmatine deiminase
MMTSKLPFQFGYVPYPLWRRRWPGWLRPLLHGLWPAVYPTREDHKPPADAASMTHYLIRFRLLPEMDTASIYGALEERPAEIEIAPDEAPIAAPDDLVRLPAQWEPLEAVIVNWPVLYPPLWPLHAAMVEAIAPAAEVVITVPAPMWAHAAQIYLAARERLARHAERVRFLVLPTDDIWVRDYGPIVGLNASGGRVALSAIYDHLPNYPQLRDNSMALRWAAHTRIPLRPLFLHTEGGNLWTDGAGTLMMSERVLAANPGHNRASLETYLRTIIDFEKLIITPRLPLESTGHVDLLIKPVDAATVLISAPDSRTAARRLCAVKSLFQGETNARGERYDVIELPTPTLYVNWLAFPIRRSYTNALTVNGRVLVPVYGLPQDEQALRVYQQVLPGYDIIPIDCRVGVNGGGAVHCMTKEIPQAAALVGDGRS